MFVLDFGKIGNHYKGYNNVGENPVVDTNTVGKVPEHDLSELAPGKVFAGEVVSVGKDKVLLKLDHGQTIQAGVTGDIQLTQGQMLAFVVKSNTGKKLAIKPMFDVNIQNSSVLKALENAGLPVNPKNAELLNLLMSEQLPIDKETITKLLRQIALYPDTDMKTLVQLQKMGIPVTEENIAKLESYQNHEYRLANEVSNVAEDISKLMGRNSSEQESPLEIFEHIADIILEEESVEKGNYSYQENGKEVLYREKNAATYQGGPVLYDNLKNEALLHNNAQNLTDIQKQALEHIETVMERFQGQESELNHIVEGLKSLNQEAEEVIHVLEEEVKNAEVKNSLPKKQDMLSKLYAAFEMYEAAEKSMEAAKTAVNTQEYELPEQPGGYGQMTKQHSEILQQSQLIGNLQENERFELAQKVQNATGDIELAMRVKNGDMKAESLLSTIRQLVQQLQQEGNTGVDTPHREKMAAMRELLHSKEFQTVVKAAIEEQLLLKPEQLNKENVQEYYQKLNQKMLQFTEMIHQLGKEDTSTMKNTNAIRQNIEYINQLNQLYSYIQLPVKLTNQNLHSELYVLTKKKKLRGHGSAFTALLHLDMEVLGSMDIYITMEKKKVSARFYLQQEDIAEFLKERSEVLIKQLEEKGFLVKAEFEKKPEEKDLSEEFTGAQGGEHMVSKYSFDIRT